MGKKCTGLALFFADFILRCFVTSCALRDVSVYRKSCDPKLVVYIAVDVIWSTFTTDSERPTRAANIHLLVPILRHILTAIRIFWATACNCPSISSTWTYDEQTRRRVSHRKRTCYTRPLDCLPMASMTLDLSSDLTNIISVHILMSVGLGVREESVKVSLNAWTSFIVGLTVLHTVGYCSLRLCDVGNSDIMRQWQ